MRDYERLIVTTVVHCAYIIVFIYLCIYFYLYIFGVCNTKSLPGFNQPFCNNNWVAKQKPIKGIKAL